MADDPEILRKRLEEKVGALAHDMRARFEHLIAHVDDRDPDQRALVEPEIHKLFTTAGDALTGMMVDEVMRTAETKRAAGLPSAARILIFQRNSNAT